MVQERNIRIKWDLMWLKFEFDGGSHHHWEELDEGWLQLEQPWPMPFLLWPPPPLPLSLWCLPWSAAFLLVADFFASFFTLLSLLLIGSSKISHPSPFPCYFQHRSICHQIIWQCLLVGFRWWLERWWVDAKDESGEVRGTIMFVMIMTFDPLLGIQPVIPGCYNLDISLLLQASLTVVSWNAFGDKLLLVKLTRAHCVNS